jgi:hypothetical protein
MAETITGALLDFSFEEKKVNIEGKIYPMSADAAKFCRVCGIPKKSSVDIKVNEKGEVVDIRPHKDQQPAPAKQEEKKDCTSSGTPAAPAQAAPAADAEMHGKLDKIDTSARTFSIKDVGDAVHPFKWTDVLDAVMKKWQPGYYLTVKYNPDTYAVKNVTYWQEGKEVWQREHKGGSGGRGYAPRNEKPAIYGCCYTEACETMRRLIAPQVQGEGDPEKQFNRLMDIARDRALKDAAELCKAAGA